jgi:putative membrane protein
MMWDAGEGMGWWMLMGGVWFVVLCLLVFWVVMKITSVRDVDAGSAIEIARKRYARGELTREEYEQLRKDLAA